MKKSIYLLCLACFVISCEKSEVETSSSNLSTRTVSSTNRMGAGTIFDFNPLSELSNIECNVLNVGNTNNPYLSAASSGYRISLNNRDDESNRQRWYIKSPGLSKSQNQNGMMCSLKLVGGNSGGNNSYIRSEKTNEESIPILVNSSGFTQATGLFTVINEALPYYYIEHILSGPFETEDEILQLQTTFLQSESSGGNSLKYKFGQNGDLAKWEIRPVGLFEVLDIDYVKLEGQLFERADQRFDQAVINNGGETILDYAFNAKGNVTESSSFSSTYGVKTSVSETIKVGIPKIDLSGTVTGETSQSWTFQNTESNTREVNHAITVHIPPGKKYQMDANLVSHNVTVGFVATLKDTTNDNKIFKVKGLWTGVTASSFYCDIIDLTTGEIVETLTEPIFESN